MKKAIALLALLALGSCKKEPETTRVVTNAGDVGYDGYADVITISGGPFANSNVVLTVDASNGHYGSYVAYIGSNAYYGTLVYQGHGLFRAEGAGTTEGWSTAVRNDQVLLSAGSLGMFVIQL